MSDLNDKMPLKLPAEKISEKIKEPPDPDDPSNNKDDSDGTPDQPDGDK